MNYVTLTMIRLRIFIYIVSLAAFSLKMSAKSAQEFILPDAPRHRSIFACGSVLSGTNFSDLDEATVRGQVESILASVKKKIIGQPDLVKKIMISMIANGHILLEGPSGLAKTRTVKAFSEAINSATWNRIQFVPDMVPTDIIGSIEYEHTTNQTKLVGSGIFQDS